MAPKKAKIGAEHVHALYDKAWTQMNEDRQMLKEQYEYLKAHFVADPEAINEKGDILVKSSETLIKQTDQVIQLVKLAKEQSDKDVGFSDEEIEEIKDELEKEKNKDKDPIT